MKDLSTVPNIGTDADFLNGDIVNDQTEVNNLAHQDPLQFFQKLMDLASLTANGNFDNEANGYQLIDALKSYIEIQEFILQSIRTEKGTKQSFLNTTPIALTVSKLVTFTKGVGDIIEITGSGAYHVIDQLGNVDGTAHGEHLYILIGGSEDIIISHLAIASNLHIETLTGEDMIVSPGTIIKFINDPDTANNFYWKMVGISQLPIATETSYGLTKTSIKIIPIRTWDMDADGNVSVAHGLTLEKIKSITGVSIFNDAKTNLRPIQAHIDFMAGVQGYVSSTDSTNVNLYRKAGGHFDSVSYATTPTVDGIVTRGWITIQYEH